MEQDDLIRRLKGLGKGTPPAAPDFTGATQPLPTISPVATRTGRLGVAPIAAAVAVLALATAGLALPKGGPLRQVLASDDTTETTEAGDDAVAAQDTDVTADPCETMPVDAETGGDAEVATEAELAEREQKAQAWAEWRAENCPDASPTTAGDDDDSDESESADQEKKAREQDRQNMARDEACTGPPPHANNPDNRDPNRTDADREAEKREWQEWHRQNCTSAGAADDGTEEAKPEDKPKAEGRGNGHEKAKGQGHGPDDANHQDRGKSKGGAGGSSRGADD